MIKDILVSILKSVLVAGLLGWLTSYLLSYDPLKCFVAVLAAQYVFFYLWNTILSHNRTNTLTREETERIVAFQQQGVTVNCAHCNQPNFIPVRMDEDNQFECESCGKHNAVYIDVTVAPKSQSLDRSILSINSLIKENQDAKKQTK